jgi:site-specific recombinase XerD
VPALAERSGVDVFRAAARSANTLAAYRSDWGCFARWCTAHDVVALPATGATLASYLAEAAQARSETARSAPWRYAPSSLGRWVATINKAHDLAGLRPPGRDPAVADTLAGIRRLRATPPTRKVPLLLDDLEAIVAGISVDTWPQAPGGLRNRALLVMGWVGAFRRSELAELQVSDVTVHPEDGVHVRVRQSKTDPEAHGQVVALPYARRSLLCAPCAWARWRAVLDAWEGDDGGPGGRAGVMRACRGLDLDQHICREASSTHGAKDAGRSDPAFRAVRANGTLGGPITGHVVTAVVQVAAAAAGYDPSLLGGHSLRSGFVTQAFRAGADAHSIMRQTRHRDPKTLEIYARESAPLVGNAVTRVGL